MATKKNDPNSTDTLGPQDTTADTAPDTTDSALTNDAGTLDTTATPASDASTKTTGLFDSTSTLPTQETGETGAMTQTAPATDIPVSSAPNEAEPTPPTPENAETTESGVPLGQPASDETLNADGKPDMTASTLENLNKPAVTNQDATFMVSPESLGAPTISASGANIATPQPIVVAKPVTLDEQHEQIRQMAGREFSLENLPHEITSVAVNGQQFLLTLIPDDLKTAANKVYYDTEKSALVFGQDIKGMIDVVYRSAPDIEHGVLAGVVAFMQSRLTKIEALIKKLEGSSVI